MPHQVLLLFEVQDLAVASPATVSRAGMVYNDYKDLGWRPYMNSWIQKYQAKQEFFEEVKFLPRIRCHWKKIFIQVRILIDLFLFFSCHADEEIVQ